MSSRTSGGVARYSVRIKKTALQELEAIAAKADRQRLVKRIRALAEDPRPRGSSKLSGQDRYRIRQGRYRVLYSIDNTVLVVYAIKDSPRVSAMV